MLESAMDSGARAQRGGRGSSLLRAAASFLLLVFLLPPATRAGVLQARAPRLRALLIGCDRFVSQPDTYPAAESNVRLLSEAFNADVRGYLSIRTAVNAIADEDAFLALVKEAFAGAVKGDLSLVYIGTHGLLDADDPESFRMLLSDGSKEIGLVPQTLFAALDAVSGKKIIIADACNSGAMIGKGMSDVRVRPTGLGGDTIVLTSAGGSEPSFLWSSGGETLQGGGYFAAALASGISEASGYSADGNKDGSVSCLELHAYLLRSYAASTPQIYPASSTEEFFRCPPAPGGQGLRTVTDLTPDDGVLTGVDRELGFSYTLNHEARVFYHLVYDREGAWDFANPQVIPEKTEGNGASAPGRKRRSLFLEDADGTSYGYVLFFISVSQGDGTVPQASALIRVQPAQGDPALGVEVTERFEPLRGEEAAIRVYHDFPCRLTLEILDGEGTRVSRLKTEEATRPQRLKGGGSVAYWDGTDAYGHQAPEGEYRVAVRAWAGEQEYAATSGPFSLVRRSPLDASARLKSRIKGVFERLDQAVIIASPSQRLGRVSARNNRFAPPEGLIDQRERRLLGHQGAVHGYGELIQHGQ